MPLRSLRSAARSSDSVKGVSSSSGMERVQCAPCPSRQSRTNASDSAPLDSILRKRPSKARLNPIQTAGSANHTSSHGNGPSSATYSARPSPRPPGIFAGVRRLESERHEGVAGDSRLFLPPLPLRRADPAPRPASDPTGEASHSARNPQPHRIGHRPTIEGGLVTERRPSSPPTNAAPSRTPWWPATKTDGYARRIIVHDCVAGMPDAISDQPRDGFAHVHEEGTGCFDTSADMACLRLRQRTGQEQSHHRHRHVCLCPRGQASVAPVRQRH